MNRTIVAAGSIVGVLILLCVLAPVFVWMRSRSYIYHTPERIPVVEAAVIPGAGVLRSGDLSAVLKDRANAAIALYRSGTVSYLVASGDNRTADYNEVVPIRNYLLHQGVPASAIVLDYAGFDTYSSMYRAKTVFGIASLVVVSQSFHLPRAVFIARSLGIRAYGYDADQGHYRSSNYFREIPADVKAIVDILAHRQPKYLGSSAQNSR